MQNSRRLPQSDFMNPSRELMTTKPALLSHRSTPFRTENCRACRFARALCRAEDKDVTQSMPYNYVSSDGKRKATLADAFVARKDAGLTSAGSDFAERMQQPWTKMGWQVSERNLVWNDDIASKLVKVGLRCIRQVCASCMAQH